jgi:regulator of protease activity HflC (stomatin/prohibitin superfamily)
MNTTIVEAIANNVAILLPFRIVHSYERGVKFRWGKDIATLEPGCHFFIPGVESIEPINVVPETRNLPTQTAYTKDGKAITFSGNVCYRVNDPRKMYTSIQDFDQSMTAFAMVHLAEHIAKRSLAVLRKDRLELESEIADTLSEKVAEWGAQIEWFGLTDIVESRAYRLFGDPLLNA